MFNLEGSCNSLMLYYVCKNDRIYFSFWLFVVMWKICFFLFVYFKVVRKLGFWKGNYDYCL